jgi:hypothetical protein
MVHAEPVPVAERWRGLDKRGLPYALVALALGALLVVVVPAVDRATGWGRDLTAAHDVLDLGSGIRLTPPVGWELRTGIRVADPPLTPPDPDRIDVELANGLTTISVIGSGWKGTPGELLDQYNRLRASSREDMSREFEVTGTRQPVTTASGRSGVQETFRTATTTGEAYAFVVPTTKGPIGTVIQVSSSDPSSTDHRQEIDAMVASLTTSSP